MSNKSLNEILRIFQTHIRNILNSTSSVEGWSHDDTEKYNPYNKNTSTCEPFTCEQLYAGFVFIFANKLLTIPLHIQSKR